MHRVLCCFGVVCFSIVGSFHESLLAQQEDTVPSVVERLLEPQWVDDAGQQMGQLLLDTWRDTQTQMPSYIREDLGEFLKRRLQRLADDIATEQYLTEERKQAVVALQFYSNSSGLLRLVDFSWPTEQEWMAIGQSHERLLVQCQRELQDKRETGTIPQDALDAVDGRVVAMVREYRNNLFHPRAFYAPTDEDVAKARVILRDWINAVERYFVQRGSLEYDSNARVFLQQQLADLDTELGTLFIDASAGALGDQSPSAERFRERHKATVEQIGTRLTQSYQAEWAAREAWMDEIRQRAFEEAERARAEAE
jgi:hypothetical protein